MTLLGLRDFIAEEVAKQSYGKTPEDEKIRIVDTIDTVLHKHADMPIETALYNVRFWVQALLRNKKTILRVDEPFTVFYPQEPNVIPFTGIFAVDYLLQFVPVEAKLQYFISNFWEIAQLFQKHREEILQCLETKNLVVISNHASWLNLPLIAICLHAFCWVPKEKIYTLLWPAITTRALAFAGIINFSNVLKTVPDTSNGKIIPEEMVTKIREQMYRKLMKSFRSPEGNVLLVAPSWTTDVYNLDTESFTLGAVSDATFTLLHRLWKQAGSLVIGVNDKQVMPTNSGLKRWEVYVWMWSVTWWESIGQAVMTLPELVLSSKWTSIWKWK